MTTQSPWREQSSPGKPPTDDRATPGTVIGGRYELIAAIGHGGMGTVWRSTDTLLQRSVAVKEVILPPTMPQHEKDALCERTMREARAAASLAHPSVVQVYDVVTDANRPWIVMELLEARSLADMVIDDGPLPPRAVAKIGIAMLGALEVAHAAGVLHRDVKPANVLICDDGRCVLTDFGVARLPSESKLTTPGMVLGSPHFISPERAVGGEFGPPSDLFSLGVTLYTAVEGGPPFDRGDPFETMRAVVEEAPRPARLAGPLKPVLWGLLEKEPERRWTVDQARTALRELLNGALAPTRKPSRSGRDMTDTDPSAVIRRPASSPPAIRSSGVGGRAMLDPSEPLADQVARLRSSAGLPPDAPDRLTADDVTRVLPVAGGASTAPASSGRGAADRAADAGPREDWLDSPARAQRPSWAGGTSWAEGQPSGGGRGSHRRGGAQPSGPGSGRARWSEATTRQHVGRRRAPSRTSQIGAKLGRELSSLRRGSGQAVSRFVRYVKAPRNRSRVIVGGGLLTLLLVLAIVTWSGAFRADSAAPPATSDPSAAAPAATPLIEVQEFRERGIAVNVPAAWTRVDAGSYVDYRDASGQTWVRINTESTGGSALDLLRAASERLRDPSVCASPYTEVELAEAPLAGLTGAQLEYTCGEGEAKRHGIWRAVVRDGTAYHFYLTTLDAEFAAHRVVYDEMVRSFQFV